MNETIGVRGGHNDRRRIVVRNSKKKKLEQQALEELKNLEKDVRKKQLRNFILIVPAMIAGKTIQTILASSKGNKKLDSTTNKEINFDDKKKDAKDFERKVFSSDGIPVSNIVEIKENKVKKERNSEITLGGGLADDEVKRGNQQIYSAEGVPKIQEKASISPRIIQSVIPLSPYIDSQNEIDLSLDYAIPEMIKGRKLLEEYEKQLKDIRYELKMTISEYNALVDEKDKLVFSHEVESLMERLSQIILKIEELRAKMKVEDLDKYDDNYIYNLIQEYLSEFKDGKAVSSIKDSELYILISEKLDELEEKKNSFEKEVEKKKESLLLKEEDFSDLKKKYYNVERINNELSDFQKRQESLLKEIQEKVDNAVTVQEKVEVQFKALDVEIKRMLNFMALSMFIPGRRAARGLATATAAYLLFAKRLLHPETVTKKYRVIKVQDYTSDIEGSIRAINDVIFTLYRTKGQIDKLIYEITTDFADYIDTIPECKDMLFQLDKMKSKIDESAYEMKKMKKEQELQMERNNAKLLKKGEFEI